MPKFSGPRCKNCFHQKLQKTILELHVQTILCCDEGNLAEVCPAQVFQKIGLLSIVLEKKGDQKARSLKFFLSFMANPRRTYLSARTQPLTATGAPSQTSPIPYVHTHTSLHRPTCTTFFIFQQTKKSGHATVRNARFLIRYT